MMKILLDGSSAVIGARAVKRYTASLIREFTLFDTRDDFKILLNYFRGSSEIIDFLIKEKSNFSKIRYPIPRRLSLRLWHGFNFPPIDILTGKVDIFHSLGDDCPPLRSGKYIVTLHGVTYLEVPELMDPGYVRAKKAWLYRMVKRADFYISVSEYTKNEFLKHFSHIEPKRVNVIPLGVDQQFRTIEQDTVKRQLFQRYGINNPYALFVGGIEPRKNVKNILRGFGEISKKYSGLDLVLAGGAEAKYLSSLYELVDELGLHSRIKFIGYIEQESDDLPILYNGAECFVFPGLSEGWTSPPLEAMACGTPVITSNVSSLPETVGNAALTVNPDDYGEIGDALDRLISDSELKKNLVRKGLQHVSHFTWGRCAEKTYEFYRRVIEL
jgi:glycosyltransferase involved in cell wall biosynthesis